MIDWAKPVQTRSGKEVRIYTRDGMEPFPVHGAIKEENGWDSATWTLVGYFLRYGSDQNDLINVPQKMKVEKWVYYDCIGNCYLHHIRCDSNLMKENKYVHEHYLEVEYEVPQ